MFLGGRFFSPFPPIVSTPGLGTLTSTVAVPRLRSRVIAPIVKALVGTRVAARLSRTSFSGANWPEAPFERLPARVRIPSPGWEKVHELLAPPALMPIMSPDRPAMLTGPVLTPAASGWAAARPTTWKTSGSLVLRKPWKTYVAPLPPDRVRHGVLVPPWRAMWRLPP